jgi:hypothetical protein
MNAQELLASFDQQQRIDIKYPDMRKDVLPHVTRFVRPAPGMSFILHSRVDEANADAVIQEQIDYFKPLNQRFEWKVYDHDTPADLKDRLIAHGFEAQDPDAVMALDLEEAPSGLHAPITADVRRITQRDQLRDVIQIEEQVWGGNFDWITKRMGDHLEIPGFLSIYVAYVDEQPACSGWIYFHDGTQFAGLWGGSTVEAYRQRGLYTAVLAIRVQEAIQRGFRFLTIDASPMSRPIVAKHGFQLLTHAHACEWKGNAE